MSDMNVFFNGISNLNNFCRKELADVRTAFKHASTEYFLDNLTNGFKETGSLLRTYIPRFKEKSMASKAFSSARGAIVLSPLAVLPFFEDPSIKDALMQSSSTLILAGALCIGRIKSNNYRNAFAVPVIGALAAESFATGANGFGVFSATIASYYALMAAMPDDRDMEALRKKMGAYFGAGGVGTILSTAQSPWEAVSAVSMVFNTISTVQIAENSHIARASKVVTHVLNTVYGVGYSESNSAELMGLLGLSAETATISENDIPRRDIDGNKLSAKEQVKAYISCLISSEQRKNFMFSSQAKETLPVPSNS